MRRMLTFLLILMLFSSGACASVSVRMDSDAALLAEDGTEIISDGRYTDIAPLGDGFFAAKCDDGYMLMNEDGELLSSTRYEAVKYSNSVLSAQQSGLWGLLSRNGTPVTEFVYTKIVTDESGIGWALTGNPNDSRSDPLLLLSADGTAQETRLYVQWMADEASTGLLTVRLAPSGLCGYCDTQGNVVIDAHYDSATPFKGDLAVVSVGGKCGVIDMTGKMVVPAEYDFADVSASGLIVVMRCGEAQAFCSDGREITRFEGESLSIALLGNGFAVDDTESCRAYDANGNAILSASAGATFLEGIDGQIIVCNDAWGETCVFLSGTDHLYRNLYPLGRTGDEALYVCMTANTARYTNDILNETQLSTDMESARYGVVNGNGEMLLDAIYLSISYLCDDRLLVQTQDAWQMIDTSGRIYWEKKK